MSSHQPASLEEEMAAKDITLTGRKKGAPKMQNFPPGGYVPQAPAYAPPPFYPPVMAAAPAPSTYRTSLANVMGSNDATVAQVSFEVFDPKQGSRVFRGTGASKREREDSHDAITGEVLAAARAYQELSARLFREARKRVRVQEAERRARELRKLKDDRRELLRTLAQPPVIDASSEPPF